MSIINKKARFNYILLERYEAGIALTGGEAKTIRSGRGDLSNAYAKFVNGELYLVNANIPTQSEKLNPTRSRKLLMHRSELISLASKVKAKKLTLVPVKLYNTRRLVKLEIALGKSKRKFEKKESIKKKDIQREIERELSAK